MSCTLVVTPNEPKETTLKRWTEIYDLVLREKELTQKRRGLRGFQKQTKENVRGEIKNARSGESDVLMMARRKKYTALDRFLVYLTDKWEMSFETYQVMEFIFRASLQSHERNLFDYGDKNYADALKKVKGTPQSRYAEILELTRQFSKKSFFGLEDIRPTKLDRVNEINKKLTAQVSQIQSIREQLSGINGEISLHQLKTALEKTAKDLESWAMKSILGEEQNWKFLSFQNGQLVMNHRGFLYFKIYILAFMGTYGEYIQRNFRGRGTRIYQLAEKKLNFESKRHFDFPITSGFLDGRERRANDDRAMMESIPLDKGFMDDALMDYIVERNSEMISAGELPFYLLGPSKRKTTA
ncbi:hypothetical protein [Pseudobdellovibrio exovorus]|uniref:Uncharacterized protein n=1 Tax=Pseudobdellovibrio exovorus JSS TaxID=1184267 RepID=M4V9L1_9BACT|nr:hypothetical protein [Pseudobdellovibrio exovorus]AGH96077.1 hypothetical protein A11Q_1861 [Pseudobdellovibrio exovorus JSS]